MGSAVYPIQASWAIIARKCDLWNFSTKVHKSFLRVKMLNRWSTILGKRNTFVGKLSLLGDEFFVWFHILFVIDIHQIMLISLFPTPFDHFHFHGSGGLILWYDLRLWRILALHASSNSQILCGWTLWGAGFCYRLWQNTEQNTGRGWTINILG